MSEYQYYEFLAIDRPLDEQQQAEVGELSTRAEVTATSFTNEYHGGDFRGDPRKMMELYYDAHLYFASWGTRQLMFRLPGTLLSLEVAEQFCIDPDVAAWASREHVILDLTSDEEEGGDWDEDTEDSLPAIVGVRAELAAGDLRPLYLAWLAGYGTWEREEDAFDDDDETELEPPVPAGLNTLTASQRALADFLRLDDDLLAVAAKASPPLIEINDDPAELASWVTSLPVAEKDTLLTRILQGQAAQVQLELRRRFHGEPDPEAGNRSRRTVAELLDAAAEIRQAR
jgi:hypothetical protein